MSKQDIEGQSETLALEIPNRKSKERFVRWLLYLCIPATTVVWPLTNIEIASWFFLGFLTIGSFVYGARFGSTKYTAEFYKNEPVIMSGEVYYLDSKELWCILAVPLIYIGFVFPFYGDEKIFGLCFDASKCGWELPVKGIGLLAKRADNLSDIQRYPVEANHLRLFTTIIYLTAISVIVHLILKYSFFIVMLDEATCFATISRKSTPAVPKPRLAFGFLVLVFVAIAYFFYFDGFFFEEGGTRSVMFILYNGGFVGNYFVFDFFPIAIVIYLYCILGFFVWVSFVPWVAFLGRNFFKKSQFHG